MKLTLIILLFSVGAFGQAPKKADQQKIDSIKNKIAESYFSFPLSELDKLMIKQHEELMKQIELEKKQFENAVAIRQDEWVKYLTNLFKSNHIPIERISDKGDSLKIGEKDVSGILKPKKK